MDGPANNWGEHIGDELLEQYALERIEDQRIARVEEHLLLCEYCRGRLEELDAYVVTLRDAIGQAAAVDAAGQPAAASAGGLRIFWAVCIAAIAVLGIVYLAPARRGLASPRSVDLRAARAPGEASAPAGAPLKLRLDLAGLDPAPEYRVQIADSGGRVSYTATVRSGPGGATVEAPPSAVGIYWVRLLDAASGELLREYGLTIAESR